VEPFRRVSGVIAPLDRANVDTDQIIPKQFLKRIERSGYGPFLFYDWRRDDNFVLNRPEYRNARFLVTGPNFGCGSSREHAAWSLADAGFRAVIAPSFADIFKSNSFRCGLLPIELPEPLIRELIELAHELPPASITVDLEKETIMLGEESIPAATRLKEAVSFSIDDFFRECLLNGWDEIALTLEDEPLIHAYEARRSDLLPTTG
jgi:3-isopropylmalate/(R)-2-methylmalate dehydratase small subunit